ncbi:putative Histidine triad nucleotide-binding protein 3 [Hypsibius exemplaris]|uniref:Adenosine 5'-monophosphoramidase HINT3 n=1 Tax=Hypsibius exemplaris TaxID=2072580 RepID=A0A1W0X694_HYPEX|nr:putative Histidine triad nucleotide-binding protein 3 [Hypsibius exemplaris]
MRTLWSYFHNSENRLLPTATSLLNMSTAAVKPPCIFCTIAAKEDATTEILYEDEILVAFRDIHPATDRHLLIVPKRHIASAKSLTVVDMATVTQLVDAGRKVLSEAGVDPADEEVRMGFHWPPFHLIHHLHLHVLYPVSKMGFLSRIVFRPDSWWFVSPETVLQGLRNKSDEQPHQ